MKKNDRLAYFQKTKAELEKNLADTGKKLAETRIRFATGALKDSSVFKKLKYEIALLNTLISQK